MNKNIAKKWVEALRSGKYAQAKGRLKLKDEKGTSYCCLGVLCEISGLGKWVANAEELSRGTQEYTTEGVYAGVGGLPDNVRYWSGMGSSLGSYDARCSALSGLNDTGKTFNEIANIIEAHVEEL